jgi:hypothetical protein
MQNFLSNVTFFILDSGDDWRDDLTTRYCEYFSRIFNGDSWRARVVYSESVDESIEKCPTRYCLIQTSSSVVCSLKFFEECSAYFDGGKNFMLCDFIMDDDYATLDRGLIVVDRERWEGAEKPLFSSGINTSPLLKTLEKTNDTRFPKSIGLHETEHVLVSRYCASNGAAMIAADIKLGGSTSALRGVVSADSHYQLKRKSKFDEIYHETYFEKNYHQWIIKKISAHDGDEYEDIQRVTADYLVAPAKGLRAAKLAGYVNAEHVVVYDKNPLALELQRRILSVKSPKLFGEILTEFKEDYPDAQFAEESADEYVVVYPTSAKTKKFICLDVFSYEFLDLAKLVDNEKSAVFDLSDIFTVPHHYFKRRTEAVEALFMEGCAALKSRRGPSFVLGRTPRDENMNSVKINTSVGQPTEETNVDKYEGWEGELPEVKKPAIAPRDPAQERLEELSALAESLGYRVDLFDGGDGSTRLRMNKVEILPDFNCVYEYTLNSANDKWSFKVNKYGYDKKLELANGNTRESLEAHVKTHNKFNSKSVVKML